MHTRARTHAHAHTNSHAHTRTRTCARAHAHAHAHARALAHRSGTTGDPKGVRINQLSISVSASHSAGLVFHPTDRYLSYLPLAHIFETNVEFALLAAGASIGFFGGNIRKASP